MQMNKPPFVIQFLVIIPRLCDLQPAPKRWSTMKTNSAPTNMTWNIGKSLIKTSQFNTWYKNYSSYKMKRCGVLGIGTGIWCLLCGKLHGLESKVMHLEQGKVSRVWLLRVFNVHRFRVSNIWIPNVQGFVSLFLSEGFDFLNCYTKCHILRCEKPNSWNSCLVEKKRIIWQKCFF